MKFSRGKPEPPYDWLMTSVIRKVAGGISLFLRPKPLKEEICYAHFPCADFPGGTRHGSPVQPAAPAPDHRHALHRNPARSLCPGALDPSILAISADLRQMALIIILIKAGLSLDLGDLRRVGCPAVLMSFLPASFEILAYILFAPMLLGVTRLEAAVMGAVLGAVSPAVVVPRMVRLMEEGRGTGEGVPQLILAGASCDDVFVIVLFSAFTGMAQGGGVNLAEFVGIPVSIGTGVLLGLGVGWLLCWFFDLAWNRGLPVRGSMKMLIVLGISFLLVAAEDWLEGILPLSGLLAVMSMACALRLWGVSSVTDRLSEKFGKLWIAAEVRSSCWWARQWISATPSRPGPPPW